MLKAHKSVYTKVGFPENGTIGTGVETVVGKYGSKRKMVTVPVETMSEIATIAAVHEFGAPNKNIPERSFLRTTLDEHYGDLQSFKVRQYQLFLQGSFGLKEAIGRVGEWLVGKVQARIRSGPFQVLSPATLAAKFPKTKPLIDTGQLLNSLQHEEYIQL
jgi:hypothetical protein